MSAGISRRMILWKMVVMAGAIGGSRSDGTAAFANPESRPFLWHLAARPERMRQRPAVHVFEFAAQRHAVGQAAGAHAVVAGKLGEVVRGGLAFHGGIGGDDTFLHLARGQARGQLFEPQ